MRWAALNRFLMISMGENAYQNQNQTFFIKAYFSYFSNTREWNISEILQCFEDFLEYDTSITHLPISTNILQFTVLVTNSMNTGIIISWADASPTCSQQQRRESKCASQELLDSSLKWPFGKEQCLWSHKFHFTSCMGFAFYSLVYVSVFNFTNSIE